MGAQPTPTLLSPQGSKVEEGVSWGISLMGDSVPAGLWTALIFPHMHTWAAWPVERMEGKDRPSSLLPNKLLCILHNATWMPCL